VKLSHEDIAKIVFVTVVAVATVFGQPFVKQFALCYRTVVLSALSCPVLSVCTICDYRTVITSLNM